jgi:hypothetical protein
VSQQPLLQVQFSVWLQPSEIEPHCPWKSAQVFGTQMHEPSWHCCCGPVQFGPGWPFCVLTVAQFPFTHCRALQIRAESAGQLSGLVVQSHWKVVWLQTGSAAGHWALAQHSASARQMPPQQSPLGHVVVKSGRF